MQDFSGPRRAAGATWGPLRGALVALALGPSICGAATEAGRFDMTLKPVRDAGGEVTGIEVTQQVTDPTLSSLNLTAAVTYAAVVGVADRIKSLDVRDPAGPISLRIEEDKPA